MHVETHLCREYEAWCANNKLPYMPADELAVELDCARDLTDDVRKIDRITHQLQWLATFIKRWEKVTRGPGAEYLKTTSRPWKSFQIGAKRNCGTISKSSTRT